MRSLLAAVLAVVIALPVMAKPADWNQNDWVKFIEEGVQVGLGEALSHAGSAVPLVDVYSALSGTSGAVRAGLQIWLTRKMEEVADSNNTALLDKYQAYFTCLTEANCSRLQQYAASTQPPPPQAETSCKPVKTIEQAESREGSRITVEASTIHVVDCPSMGEIYVYEYHNRPGFRVIKPGDWSHAIGGKDFPTMAEAMNVAAGQIININAGATSPAPSSGGGSNPQTMTLDVNGHTNTLDLATNKITASGGVIHGSDVIFEKWGNLVLQR